MNQDDKRKAARYICDGGVEVRTTGSNAGFWGTLTDLSADGCYVSSFSPMAAATKVDLVVHIKPSNLEFKGQGEVMTSHPGVGMGIRFDSISEQDAAVLAHVIAELKQIEDAKSAG